MEPNREWLETELALLLPKQLERSDFPAIKIIADLPKDPWVCFTRDEVRALGFPPLSNGTEDRPLHAFVWVMSVAFNSEMLLGTLELELVELHGSRMAELVQ